jgi:hypothetical protein
MIDLWQIPPSRAFAENHGKACRPGKGQSVDINKKNQICPCCLNTINKEEVPLF